MAKSKFEKEMDAVLKKLEKAIEAEIAITITTGFHDLVLGTPFLTGQLMSNWRIGLDKINNKILRFKRDASTTKTKAFLNSAKRASIMEKYRLKHTIHFFNNIEYALKIEEKYNGYGKIGVQMIERNLERNLQRLANDPSKWDWAVSSLQNVLSNM